MDRVIVYVDDAAYAEQVLAPLFARDASRQTEWVLVACAPRMTHRISKWVSHSARENWRNKWLAKTQEQLLPLLQLDGGQVISVLAKGPLAELTQRLKMEHGAARVIDARRPKIGVDLEPVAPDVKSPGQSGWAVPGAVLGMGALLMLANELSE